MDDHEAVHFDIPLKKYQIPKNINTVLFLVCVFKFHHMSTSLSVFYSTASVTYVVNMQLKVIGRASLAQLFKRKLD